MSPRSAIAGLSSLIRLLLTILLLVLLIVGALLTTGCAAEGKRNALKDRTTLPAAYEPMSVGQMLGFQPKVATEPGASNRHQWSAESAAEIDAWEKRAVCVQGYVVAMHANPFDGDLIMNLAEKPTHGKDRSMVVEASPQFQKLQPDWTGSAFKQLANQRALVRVSGWLFYDDFHDGAIGSWRGTLWEVHPITRIDVWNGKTWQPLGKYPGPLQLQGSLVNKPDTLAPTRN